MGQPAFRFVFASSLLSAKVLSYSLQNLEIPGRFYSMLCSASVGLEVAVLVRRLGDATVIMASILIVEDEFIVAEDLAMTVKDLGHTVAGNVSSAEEAVQVAEESRPDLVLMDINLGDGSVDGVEAAERIRYRFNVPVVYLTAFTDPETVERAKMTEPYGYVAKPFSLWELRSTIETALYKHAADKRVRQSEERLRLVMEATRDGVWDWDIRTGDTYYSPAYFAMLGYDAEAFPKHYKTWLELLHPDDRELAWTKTQDCLQGNLPVFQAEFRMRHRDGSWRQIESRGKIVAWDEDGTATRMLGTITDVTARKEAEERLRRSEAKYRTVLETAVDGVLLLDDTGRILEVNDAYCRMIG